MPPQSRCYLERPLRGFENPDELGVRRCRSEKRPANTDIRICAPQYSAAREWVMWCKKL
jgi:hypothetical protein